MEVLATWAHKNAPNDVIIISIKLNSKLELILSYLNPALKEWALNYTPETLKLKAL